MQTGSRWRLSFRVLSGAHKSIVDSTKASSVNTKLTPASRSRSVRFRSHSMLQSVAYPLRGRSPGTTALRELQEQRQAALHGQSNSPVSP